MINSETKMIIDEKLKISQLLSLDDQKNFWIKIVSYLDHGRTESINGRTDGFLAKRFDDYCVLFSAFGLSDKEIIEVIFKEPSIINNQPTELYYKYLILGVTVFNKDERNEKLLNKPSDYRTSLKKIFARYSLMHRVGYPIISISSLLHDTDSEFAHKFVRKNYYKPYQFLDDETPLLNEDWMNEFPCSEEAIECFKELEINKELVAKIEGKFTRG